MLVEISLKFAPKVAIDDKLSSGQVMVWRQIGDKPLSEATMTQLTDAYLRHLPLLS